MKIEYEKVIEELNSKILLQQEEIKQLKNNQNLNYTINEANNEVDRISNLLDLWISRKQILFDNTQPKPTNVDNENVDGTPTREEKFYKYVYKCDIEDIDWWIDKLNDYKIKLVDYTEQELKRINEYDDLLQKIIYYKEIYKPQKNEKITWDWISKKVYSPEATIRRMYRKHKKLRSIDF